MTALPAPALVIRGLCADGPDGRPAVEDFSLDVAAGSLTALVGESDVLDVLAGCILGEVHPTAGSIEAGGLDLSVLSRTELDHWRLAILHSLDRSSVLPSLTGAQNIAEAEQRRSGSARHPRTASILARLPLGADAQRSVSTMTPFSLAVVRLGRALAWDPEVMTVEHPQPDLDLYDTSRLLDCLRDLCHLEGRTVLVFSDATGEAAEADRVVQVPRATR